MWNIKYYTHEHTYEQRQTHKHKIKLAVPGGRGGGHGWGVWAEQIHTYIGWINIKVLLDSTGNCTQYPVITHNGKEGERICRCTAKSLLYSENKCIVNQLSVQFSRSVRSDSWLPHGQSLHAKQILWVKFKKGALLTLFPFPATILSFYFP